MNATPHCSSLDDVLFKVFRQKLDIQPLCDAKGLSLAGCLQAHWCPFSNVVDKGVELPNHSESSGTVDGPGETKLKRKKLKGKRAVVRWLKFFRWKKKKEYGRMTAEEKILFKLRKVYYLPLVDLRNPRNLGTRLAGLLSTVFSFRLMYSRYLLFDDLESVLYTLGS